MEEVRPLSEDLRRGTRHPIHDHLQDAVQYITSARSEREARAREQAFHAHIGRQLGKTQAGIMELLRELRNTPGSNGMVITPMSEFEVRHLDRGCSPSERNDGKIVFPAPTFGATFEAGGTEFISDGERWYVVSSATANSDSANDEVDHTLAELIRKNPKLQLVEEDLPYEIEINGVKFQREKPRKVDEPQGRKVRV